MQPNCRVYCGATTQRAISDFRETQCDSHGDAKQPQSLQSSEKSRAGSGRRNFEHALIASCQCGVMVAAAVSKTTGEIRGGSIPLTDTNLFLAVL